MDLDDYTPDAICKAMGLPSFAEDPALREHTDCLRVLFRPSFHPEVCVTCWPEQNGLAIQTTALLQMLWHERQDRADDFTLLHPASP